MVRALLGGPNHPVWQHAHGAAAPQLLLVETANALVQYVRTGRLSLLDATEALASLLRLRLGLISLRALAVPALEYSLRYSISAYDACYLALAEQSGAVLVTADRRLAALATRSELVA